MAVPAMSLGSCFQNLPVPVQEPQCPVCHEPLGKSARSVEPGASHSDLVLRRPENATHVCGKCMSWLLRHAQRKSPRHKKCCGKLTRKCQVQLATWEAAGFSLCFPQSAKPPSKRLHMMRRVFNSTKAAFRFRRTNQAASGCEPDGTEARDAQRAHNRPESRDSRSTWSSCATSGSTLTERSEARTSRASGVHTPTRASGAARLRGCVLATVGSSSAMPLVGAAMAELRASGTETDVAMDLVTVGGWSTPGQLTPEPADATHHDDPQPSRRHAQRNRASRGAAPANPRTPTHSGCGMCVLLGVHSTALPVGASAAHAHRMLEYRASRESVGGAVSAAELCPKHTRQSQGAVPVLAQDVCAWHSWALRMGTTAAVWVWHRGKAVALTCGGAQDGAACRPRACPCARLAMHRCVLGQFMRSMGLPMESAGRRTTSACLGRLAASGCGHAQDSLERVGGRGGGGLGLRSTDDVRPLTPSMFNLGTFEDQTPPLPHIQGQDAGGACAPGRGSMVGAAPASGCGVSVPLSADFWQQAGSFPGFTPSSAPRLDLSPAASAALDPPVSSLADREKVTLAQFAQVVATGMSEHKVPSVVRFLPLLQPGLRSSFESLVIDCTLEGLSTAPRSSLQPGSSPSRSPPPLASPMTTGTRVPPQAVVSTPPNTPEWSPRDPKKRRFSELDVNAAASTIHPALACRAEVRPALALCPAWGTSEPGPDVGAIKSDRTAPTGVCNGVDISDISVGTDETSTGPLFSDPRPARRLVSIRCAAQVGQCRTAACGADPDRETRSGSRRAADARVAPWEGSGDL